VSVLTDHRADPGDDVPAELSSPTDGDTEVTSLDPSIAEVTQVDAVPAAADETELERPPLRPDELRADFGAHFEANYQRLVAQLYAITLNPAEAHDVVREAYSRAWRRWADVGSSADPTRAALAALGRLPDPERRAVVLVDMAGVPVVEVAILEQVPPGTVAARLSRGRRVVGDALSDVAPATPVPIGPYGHGGRW
jgi:DNA-directed RNA polymerase specialized sigma24 family protein